MTRTTHLCITPPKFTTISEVLTIQSSDDDRESCIVTVVTQLHKVTLQRDATKFNECSVVAVSRTYVSVHCSPQMCGAFIADNVRKPKFCVVCTYENSCLPLVYPSK